MFKDTIKEHTPSCFLNLYYKLQYPLHVWPLVRYDANRFIRCSGKRDTEESLIGLITNDLHSIEKGFTMPDFRKGFGQKRLLEVLKLCKMYVEKYGVSNIQITEAARSVYDYKKCHENLHYSLPDNLKSSIDNFLSYFPGLETDSIQFDMTKEEYFSKHSNDFEQFSYSRRSCRNFTDEPIDISVMKKAIRLAQNAPSACNRQSPRVYLVSNPIKVKEVLQYQGGNRGFGQTVNKLVVICGYLGNYHDTERNCVYIDSGIFTMNMAYALHYYGIGCCILNWSVDKKRDKKLRNILSVRDGEVIVTILACGNVPDNFKLCRSEKKSLEGVLTEI